MTEAHKQYVLVAKVETMILRNQTVVKESEEYISNRVNMLDPSAVLKSRQKTKFFTGPFPEQFETLTFLGPAKYHLKHSDSKGRDNAKKPNQRNTDNMGPTTIYTERRNVYNSTQAQERIFTNDNCTFVWGSWVFNRQNFYHLDSVYSVAAFVLPWEVRAESKQLV